MGNCCASSDIDTKGQHYYKICVGNIPQESDQVFNRQFSCSNIQATAGNKPVILNLWTKESKFDNSGESRKAKRIFYDDADLIVFIIDVAKAGAAAELSNLKKEIKEAQYSNSGIIELSVGLILINHKVDERENQKIRNEALENNWMVAMPRENSQSGIEGEIRKYVQRLTVMGVKPKGAEDQTPILENENDEEWNKMVEEFRNNNTSPTKGSIVFGGEADPILRKQSMQNDLMMRNLVQNKL